MSDRFHVSDCGCLDCRLKVEQIKQVRRNSNDIAKLESEHAEMLKLLRGCHANGCPMSPGPLRWVCRCREKIAELLARIDGKDGG